MFGFGTHAKCDTGIFLFAASLIAIMLVLAVVGTLSYFR